MSGNTVITDRLITLSIRWPKLTLVVVLLLFLVAVAQLSSLTVDTRADAFLSSDNPALLYRDRVKEQFGLSDPIVIAVVHEQGIFSPAVLQFVAALTDAVMEVDNIEYSRVVSLATEKDIRSGAEGMEVVPFFEPWPEEEGQAEYMEQAVRTIPLYMGSLVADAGIATLITAELVDDGRAEEAYQSIQVLIEDWQLPAGVSVHVAGEGAISGYLGGYIDADAKRLNPLTGLIILSIIFIAYKRWLAVFLCASLIAASVLITLGVMAQQQTPFYIITNALPVILIGISVADAIHIFSHYYDLQAKSPQRQAPELMVETIGAMWRPITLTTLTTMAGFLGLYFAAYMPPFKAFGLYAALGVAMAWLYSLTLLPAAMSLLQPRVSERFIAAYKQGGNDRFGQLMVAIGRFTFHKGGLIIAVFAALIIVGGYAASQLMVDEDRIDIFHPSEPIYQADKIINRYFDGTNTLDVVVETPTAEGLFEVTVLEQIEALQSFAETLPHVQGSISIVDYLKQINRALNEGNSRDYRLPDSSDLVAQYFLIYAATSDPTDFEEEIDYDYQTANVRISMNSGGYQDIKYVVEELNRYIGENLNNQEVHATLSGRVNLNYHWIKDLAESHFKGLALALILVWLVASLLFKSAVGGLFSLIPVAASVLLVYATMVLGNMNLGVGSSMFAAVAIGLGVDFSIHTLDRFKSLCVAGGNSMESIFNEFYRTTGRALLFNFLAISCGFGVLILSKISSLNNFGAIVCLAVSVSFIASMTLLPALIHRFRPDFIFKSAGTISAQSLSLLFVASLCALYPRADVYAEELTADVIVQNVNGVDRGDFVTRGLTMKLIDKRGKSRERETVIYRKEYEGSTKTVLFYLSPANVRNTGFLVWDYRSDADNDQWLYLPALRKVRRVSASDRGDYFLGTDFTYDDIQLDGQLEPRDYDFTLLGEELLAGVPSYRLSSKPKTKAIAKELGYGRTEFWVDKSNWMVLKVEFLDLKNKPLKRMSISGIKQVGNILTRHELHVVNHKTGHQTQFTFSDVDYKTPVKDSWFTKRALSRGH